MKDAIQTILIGALLIGAGILIGRFTAPEKKVMVTADPDLDSITAVVLRGKIDSVKYSDLLLSYNGLLKSFANRLKPVAETVWVDLGEDAELVRRASARLDTAVELSVTAVVGDDTTKVTSDAEVLLSVVYLSEPFDAFVVESLLVSLPPMSFPVKRIDPTINIDRRLFSAAVIAAVNNGSPGAGGEISLGPVQIGAAYHTNKSWTFLAGWRLY